MTTADGGPQPGPGDCQDAVIVTFPAARPGPSAMAGWHAGLIRADTGQPITTCLEFDVTIRCHPSEVVTVTARLFTDADGQPLYDGQPVVDGGEIRTGVFRFLVSGVRVAG